MSWFFLFNLFYSNKHLNQERRDYFRQADKGNSGGAAGIHSWSDKICQKGQLQLHKTTIVRISCCQKPCRRWWSRELFDQLWSNETKCERKLPLHNTVKHVGGRIMLLRWFSLREMKESGDCWKMNESQSSKLILRHSRVLERSS